MAKTPTSPAGRPAAAARAGWHGYTLVELLVVLAILALMVTLATPLLGGGAARELQATAGRIGTELRATRARAMHDNRPAALGFDVRAGTVADDAGRVVARLPERVAMRLVTAEPERLSPTEGRIRFLPDGSSTGGRVTLSGDALTVAVDVDWFDGHVEVHDAPGG